MRDGGGCVYVFEAGGKFFFVLCMVGERECAFGGRHRAVWGHMGETILEIVEIP